MEERKLLHGGVEGQAGRKFSARQQVMVARLPRIFKGTAMATTIDTSEVWDAMLLNC